MHILRNCTIISDNTQFQRIDVVITGIPINISAQSISHQDL